MWTVQTPVKNLTDDLPARARILSHCTQEECGDCPLKPVGMEKRLHPLNQTFIRGTREGLTGRAHCPMIGKSGWKIGAVLGSWDEGPVPMEEILGEKGSVE